MTRLLLAAALLAAGHGFNDDTAASYDEAAAVAAWAVTIGWFDPHLQPLP